jgi:SAM-dependent methyltransferase
VATCPKALRLAPVHRLFASVIAPLIEALEPRAIAEVGCGSGRLTRRLLEAQGAGEATLYAIDPAPRLAADLIERGGDRLVVHPERAIAALGGLGPVDFALLDGDPNWHAVHSSLELLIRNAERAERAAPLVVVHHVHWPFGRRDGYYDPAAIPPAQLHDHSDLGVVPGRRDPDPEGLRLTPFLAVRDFLPRSGVLTAIDEIVAAGDLDWTLLEVPGFHGIGVLAEARLLAERPALTRVLEDLASSRFLGAQARRAEAARVETAVRLAAARRALALADPDLEPGTTEDEIALQTPPAVSAGPVVEQEPGLVERAAEYRAQKEALEWRLGRVEEDLASRTDRAEELEALVESQVRLEHATRQLRAEGDAGAELRGRVSELEEELGRAERELLEAGENERLSQGRLAHTAEALDAVKDERDRLRAQADGLQVELRAAVGRIDEIAAHLSEARSTRRARLGRRIVALARAATFRGPRSGHLDSARAAAERALPSSISAVDGAAAEIESDPLSTRVERPG